MSGLELEDINVWLNGQKILHDVNISIAKGECVALLGPSGCGKTTTLRTIAGFIHPQAGDVRISGQSCVDLPPNRRNVGLVFQDYALFPHMTVDYVCESVAIPSLKSWSISSLRWFNLIMLRIVCLKAFQVVSDSELRLRGHW